MNRGEVWQVSFDPSVGQEIQKTRPAVIISSDALGALALRVVVPFTGWQAQFVDAAWLIRIDPSPQNGLAKASAADAFQVKSLSIQRFVRRMGAISIQELNSIVEAVGTVIQHP
jgi:mRNA interferase MazF